LEFCASQHSKIPCPYDAYCPFGELGEPFHGVRKGTIQWSPTIDAPNSWVQIGETNPCFKYNSLEPHPPIWGLSGKGNEQFSRYIYCCDKGEYGEQNDESKVDLSMSLSMPEELIIDSARPIWFGRKHGYHGTSHEEAELFCRAVGQFHLCPAEAYCVSFLTAVLCSLEAQNKVQLNRLNTAEWPSKQQATVPAARCL